MNKKNFNFNYELNKEQRKEENNYSINKISNESHYNEKLRQENYKYYVPICREKGCDGNVIISIDEINFLVKYTCEKNKDHGYFEHLFLETFEKLYLKEKIIQTCFKCSNNLEGKNKFKYIECDNYYCATCFLLDKHIQKDLKNLNVEINKCQKDQSEINYYCLDCHQKICFCCFKKNEENNQHKYHNIKNILEVMPTIYQINALKEKILKKSDSFDSLIKYVDEWQKKLNEKIERIKQNLRIETKILKKLFLNFNMDYKDYTYYSNFHSFFKTIKDYNNDYLKGFKESKNFEDKTKYIFDLLKLGEPKSTIKKIKVCLKKIININYHFRKFY